VVLTFPILFLILTPVSIFSVIQTIRLHRSRKKSKHLEKRCANLQEYRRLDNLFLNELQTGIEECTDVLFGSFYQGYPLKMKLGFILDASRSFRITISRSRSFTPKILPSKRINKLDLIMED
jgi:hypothetical protein